MRCGKPSIYLNIEQTKIVQEGHCRVLITFVLSCSELNWIAIIYNIVACQAHPALGKIGLILAHIFHFNGWSVYAQLRLQVCLVHVRSTQLYTHCGQIKVSCQVIMINLYHVSTYVRTKGLTTRLSSRPGAKAA